MPRTLEQMPMRTISKAKHKRLTVELMAWRQELMAARHEALAALAFLSNDERNHRSGDGSIVAGVIGTYLMARIWYHQCRAKLENSRVVPGATRWYVGREAA